jgi:hypothetical protein
MAVAAHAKAIQERQENNGERNAIQHARRDAQPIRTPTSGGSPDRAVIKTLRKKKRRQDSKANDDPQKEPTQVHRVLAILLTFKFTMRNCPKVESRSARRRNRNSV